MTQVAKLLIRGSLVNKTAKNLTMDQMIETQRVIDLAFNDPALGAARAEFCAALARTIGQEYKDIDRAMQEVYVSFWMTSVDILYHRPKKHIIKLLNNTCATNGCYSICLIKDTPTKVCPACGSIERLRAPEDLIGRTTDAVESYYTSVTNSPAPERDYSIIKNPSQRKKFYQTCLFNYLRQILRENTYPKTTTAVVIQDYADSVYLKQVQSELLQTDIADECELLLNTGSGLKAKPLPSKPYTIIAPTLELPLQTIKTLNNLNAVSASHNVTITILDQAVDNRLGKIIISAIGSPVVISGTIISKARIQHISIDGPSDDAEESGQQYQLNSEDDIREKHKAFASDDASFNDSVSVIRDRLCETGKLILDIIIKPPEDYTTQYGNKISKNCIAAYLNMSCKEVQRQWSIIEIQMRAVDLVPRSK